MYKCQICHRQSKAGEVQFTLVKKRFLQPKGWQIESERKVCYNCYIREKAKNGNNTTI